MADNLGAKPYDYKDYYTSGRYPPALGVGGNPNAAAPGMGIGDKWRGFLGMLGVNTAPVTNEDPSLGSKLRYMFGASPLVQPQASQADVRKVDNAIASPAPSLMDRMFGASAAVPPVAPAPAIAPAPTAAPDMSLANELYNQGTQARPLPAPGPGALPGVAPMTATDIRGTAVPPSGTGGFVNNATGAVTNLDTRVAGPGAEAGGFVNRAAPGSLASFFGAAMNQKQIAATETRDLAKAKLAQEFALKLPGAMKDTAEAGNVSLRSQAAQAHLAANPGDYAGAAGIASGRIQPGDKHVFLPTMDGNKVDVGNKATGAIQRKTPLPQINEADILQTMKNNKMTREQVLARLKAEGKM